MESPPAPLATNAQAPISESLTVEPSRLLSRKASLSPSAGLFAVWLFPDHAAAYDEPKKTIWHASLRRLALQAARLPNDAPVIVARGVKKDEGDVELDQKC